MSIYESCMTMTENESYRARAEELADEYTLSGLRKLCARMNISNPENARKAALAELIAKQEMETGVVAESTRLDAENDPDRSETRTEKIRFKDVEGSFDKFSAAERRTSSNGRMNSRNW